MKFTNEIIINKPIEKVIELMDSNNLKEWLPQVVSVETIEGVRGEVGAKSKIVSMHNGRKWEVIETITKKDFTSDYSGVNEHSGTQTAPGVVNLIRNFYIRIDQNSTKLIVENEFAFSNLIMKIIGFLLFRTYKKRIDSQMTLFKSFAENK